MKWLDKLFKNDNLVLNSKKEHLRELSRGTSMTYYYKHRDKILEKRRKRYHETGL